MSEQMQAARTAPRLERDALREYGIVACCVVLFVVLSLSSSAFLTSTNILNILDQWSAPGIVALGATAVIVAGGFDLSVAGIFAVAGVVAARVAGSSSPELGLLAGVLSGAALGVVNAVLVTVLRINAFIATLATALVFGGLATMLSDGFLVSVRDPSFRTLGADELLGVRLSIWLLALMALLVGWLMSRTNFGRYIYATGGNPQAARLSGVRTDLVRASTFVMSGLCAGIGGVIVASRTGTGQADAGSGVELTAIAAVVLGGTSIAGGTGAAWRTVLGALLLAMIGNGFNLLNVDPTYQQMAQGAIIAAAVAVDVWARRRT